MFVRQELVPEDVRRSLTTRRQMERPHRMALHQGATGPRVRAERRLRQRPPGNGLEGDRQEIETPAPSANPPNELSCSSARGQGWRPRRFWERQAGRGSGVERHDRVVAAGLEFRLVLRRGRGQPRPLRRPRLGSCRLTFGLRPPLRVTRGHATTPTTQAPQRNGETLRRPVGCTNSVSPGNRGSQESPDRVVCKEIVFVHCKRSGPAAR